MVDTSTELSHDGPSESNALAFPSVGNVTDNTTAVCKTMTHTLWTNQQLVFTLMFNAQQDWHVGVGLWKVMGDELHKKCDKLCHQHGPVHSGGQSTFKSSAIFRQ